MSYISVSRHALRRADLPQNRPSLFDLTLSADEIARICTELNLTELRKLRFAGQILADGSRDFRLNATLGATVIQPCVVTLHPVTSRIDTQVTRRYVHNPGEPEDDETQMPEDETIEKLGEWIDPQAVMIEALSLALPVYPRITDAALEQSQFSAPGIIPMSDEAARPFSGLAGLRDQIRGESD